MRANRGYCRIASATTSNYAITDLVKDVDDALAAVVGNEIEGGVQKTDLKPEESGRF